MSGPRVLVVDDAEDLRDLIALIIDTSEGGWQVVGTAGDGDAAVDQARRTAPDLVLLDISMPVRDGLQVLPEVKQAAPEALVVMLTGHADHDARAAALAAGADGYLEKGDLVATLVPYVRELLERRTPTERRQ